MTTEKNTSPVREPYDAMGPVDAPNPPAARATLADVQPGGRVRLGDQALRVFSAGRWTYDGTGQSFSHEEIDAAAFVVYRDAALSAQPSPGGQDALHEAARRVISDIDSGDYGGTISMATYDALVAALAARQPVGEPVPSIPSELAPVVAALKRFDECAEDCDSEGCDIGRAWFDALTTMGLLKRTQRSPAVWTMTAEGERLLDLIDSQAVGK
ncbi:hypothetical protein MU483_13785 [Staphylococcus aureus]|nr:hypothetical protein [Staphylococcus aureus]